MKTDVRDTSLEAYYTEVRCGHEGSQMRTIFDLVRSHRAPMTREQIKDYLGYEINVVCGRVNKLIKNGALCRGVKVREDHYGKPCSLRETVMVASPQLSLLDGKQGDAMEARPWS